jgi:hypothetical protein
MALEWIKAKEEKVVLGSSSNISRFHALLSEFSKRILHDISKIERINIFITKDDYRIITISFYQDTLTMSSLGFFLDIPARFVILVNYGHFSTTYEREELSSTEVTITTSEQASIPYKKKTGILVHNKIRNLIVYYEAIYEKRE